jgi:hypothetical protein
MLRFSSSLLLASALAVVGCPVYDDECVDDSGCGPGAVCHLPTRECVLSSDPDHMLPRCTRPSECDTAETCDRFGRCRAESCVDVGCVSGYRCAVQEGFEHCMRSPATGGAGGESGSAGEAGALNQGGGAGG